MLQLMMMEMPMAVTLGLGNIICNRPMILDHHHQFQIYHLFNADVKCKKRVIISPVDTIVLLPRDWKGIGHDDGRADYVSLQDRYQ